MYRTTHVLVLFLAFNAFAQDHAATGSPQSDNPTGKSDQETSEKTPEQERAESLAMAGIDTQSAEYMAAVEDLSPEHQEMLEKTLDSLVKDGSLPDGFDQLKVSDQAKIMAKAVGILAANRGTPLADKALSAAGQRVQEQRQKAEAAGTLTVAVPKQESPLAASVTMIPPSIGHASELPFAPTHIVQGASTPAQGQSPGLTPATPPTLISNFSVAPVNANPAASTLNPVTPALAPEPPAAFAKTSIGSISPTSPPLVSPSVTAATPSGRGVTQLTPDTAPSEVPEPSERTTGSNSYPQPSDETATTQAPAPENAPARKLASIGLGAAVAEPSETAQDDLKERQSTEIANAYGVTPALLKKLQGATGTGQQPKEQSNPVILAKGKTSFSTGSNLPASDVTQFLLSGKI